VLFLSAVMVMIAESCNYRVLINAGVYCYDPSINQKQTRIVSGGLFG
jgi:hypothetical protein